MKVLDKLRTLYYEHLVVTDEERIIIAQKNIQKQLKVHPLIIILCTFLMIFRGIPWYRQGQITEHAHYFHLYIALIIGSTLSLIACYYVKKHPTMKAGAQQFPTHFSFTYIYVLIFMLIKFGTMDMSHPYFHSFIIFACISIITPIFFDIEPIVYYFLEFGIVISLIPTTIKVLNWPISISILVFTLITTTHSLNKWRVSKKDFQHQKMQNEYIDKMKKELSLAALVQSSFFKHEETLYDNWTLVYYTKAMSGVSGDFFDFYTNGKSLDGIGIFDVSGHGIASGLVTMLVKNIITKEFVRGKSDSLKTIVDRINVRFSNEKGNIENYLTGILCRITGNTVNFVNAGHSLPILYKANNGCTEINDKPNEKAFGAIGLQGISNNFVDHSVSLDSGDELIFFTDGITDTQNENGDSFGRERLIRSINRNADRPLQTQINCIISDVTNFSNSKPQDDDITMIILKKK